MAPAGSGRVARRRFPRAPVFPPGRRRVFSASAGSGSLTAYGSSAEGIVTVARHRIGLRVAAAAGPRGPSRQAAWPSPGRRGPHGRRRAAYVGQLSIPALDNARDLTFTSCSHRPWSHRRVLRLRRRGPPNKGYLLFPGTSAQLSQRELPGLGPDPGDRAERPGHGRVLVDANNANLSNPNFGFYSLAAALPHRGLPDRDNASPPVDQLLGINDSDVAVGFYTDGQGNNHGYTYNIRDHRFTAVTVPGASLAQPDRHRDQQPRRRGRLLHLRGRHDGGLPALSRSVPDALASGCSHDPGARRQRPG